MDQAAETTGHPPHLVPLGSTGWRIWRDICLRSAGFPAHRVRDLADTELAEAADAAIAEDAHRASRDGAHRASYDGAYERATGRLTAAIRRTAAEPRFREAVTWQNRAMVATCLDKAAAGEPRNVRGRNHELAIAGYLQRYTVKNDTIGFFGPVGWASVEESAGARLTASPGVALLRRRSVYLETWAVDTLARTLADDPDALPWLVPIPDPTAVREDRVLHRPEGLPLMLTPVEAAVLAACDGVRTAGEVARLLAGSGPRELRTPQRVMRVVAALRDHQAVSLTLEGPVEARPEDTLRARLEAIGAPEYRERALARLERLTSQLEALSHAAGDADRVARRMDHLNETFADLTGAPPTRRHGLAYAGRTLAYEDTVRDVDVSWGAELLGEVAEPLGLLLDSSRWLAHRIGREYQELFTRIHRRWRDRGGAPRMPLARLIGAATPQMYFSLRSLPAPVRTAVGDFQERWGRVLGDPPPGGGPRHLSTAALRDRVAAEFPPTPPLWATAVHHAPDLLVAARRPGATGGEDLLFVLGELHVAFNPLESRLFVEHHPEPDRLRAADAADHGGRRIYQIPSKDSLAVTSRLAPPSATLAEDGTYWTFGSPSVRAPGRMLPLAGLAVEETGDGALVVRDAEGSIEAPLPEVVGELLSHVSVNSFTPFPRSPHRPRVTVDRLVVAREAWDVPVSEVSAWARLTSERERFLACRRWRAERGLPERAFYKAPSEDKPQLVDFASIVLVNILAKAVRKEQALSGRQTIGFSEMLPDVDQMWLHDAEGEGYSSEFRVIAVDPLR